MTPSDVERIRDTMLGMITELQQSDAFHQRPKAQLQTLEGRLIEWSDDSGNQVALQAIRESVHDICMRVPAEDASRETCMAFLDQV